MLRCHQLTSTLICCSSLAFPPQEEEVKTQRWEIKEATLETWPLYRYLIVGRLQFNIRSSFQRHQIFGEPQRSTGCSRKTTKKIFPHFYENTFRCFEKIFLHVVSMKYVLSHVLRKCFLEIEWSDKERFTKEMAERNMKDGVGGVGRPIFTNIQLSETHFNFHIVCGVNLMFMFPFCHGSCQFRELYGQLCGKVVF